MRPPIICAGCGQVIEGEPYTVEMGLPDPRRIGIVMFYCEASHAGAQLEETIEPSIADGLD